MLVPQSNQQRRPSVLANLALKPFATAQTQDIFDWYLEVLHVCGDKEQALLFFANAIVDQHLTLELQQEQLDALFAIAALHTKDDAFYRLAATCNQLPMIVAALANRENANNVLIEYELLEWMLVRALQLNHPQLFKELLLILKHDALKHSLLSMAIVKENVAMIELLLASGAKTDYSYEYTIPLITFHPSSLELTEPDDLPREHMRPAHKPPCELPVLTVREIVQATMLFEQQEFIGRFPPIFSNPDVIKLLKSVQVEKKMEAILDANQLATLESKLLVLAIGLGCVELIKKLLEQGVSLVRTCDARLQELDSPWHLAAYYGDMRIISPFANAPDSNIHCSRGPLKLTPLMIAAQRGHAEVVEQLLAARVPASVTHTSSDGRNALAWSLTNEQNSVVSQKLFSVLHIQCNKDKTELLQLGAYSAEWAARLGNRAFLNYLMSYNDIATNDVSFQIENNPSPLMQAAYMGHFAMVKQLTENTYRIGNVGSVIAAVITGYIAQPMGIKPGVYYDQVINRLAIIKHLLLKNGDSSQLALVALDDAERTLKKYINILAHSGGPEMMFIRFEKYFAGAKVIIQSLQEMEDSNKVSRTDSMCAMLLYNAVYAIARDALCADNPTLPPKLRSRNPQETLYTRTSILQNSCDGWTFDLQPIYRDKCLSKQYTHALVAAKIQCILTTVAHDNNPSMVARFAAAHGTLPPKLLNRKEAELLKSKLYSLKSLKSYLTMFILDDSPFYHLQFHYMKFNEWSLRELLELIMLLQQLKIPAVEQEFVRHCYFNSETPEQFAQRVQQAIEGEMSAAELKTLKLHTRFDSLAVLKVLVYERIGTTATQSLLTTLPLDVFKLILKYVMADPAFIPANTGIPKEATLAVSSLAPTPLFNWMEARIKTQHPVTILGYALRRDGQEYHQRLIKIVQQGSEFEQERLGQFALLMVVRSLRQIKNSSNNERLMLDGIISVLTSLQRQRPAPSFLVVATYLQNILLNSDSNIIKDAIAAPFSENCLVFMASLKNVLQIMNEVKEPPKFTLAIQGPSVRYAGRP